MTGMHGPDDPNSTLPYASSLCGACYDVCPVKINIPEILVHLRAKDVDQRREQRGQFRGTWDVAMKRSEEHTSELQSRGHLVCRLLLEKKNTRNDQAREPETA